MDYKGKILKGLKILKQEDNFWDLLQYVEDFSDEYSLDFKDTNRLIDSTKGFNSANGYIDEPLYIFVSRTDQAKDFDDKYSRYFVKHGATQKDKAKLKDNLTKVKELKQKYPNNKPFHIHDFTPVTNKDWDHISKLVIKLMDDHGLSKQQYHDFMDFDKELLSQK